MKLYATVTSERASKGQGGNSFLFVKFMDDKQIVARVEFHIDDRGYCLEIYDREGGHFMPLLPLGGEIEKGKRQKGEKEPHAQDCPHNWGQPCAEWCGAE